MNAVRRPLVWSVFLILTALVLPAQKTNPKPLATPSPGYPDSLEDSGKSGQARVAFVVKADGSVAEARLLSADDPAFGEAALAVIGDWKFEPATVDGVAVDAPVAIPFRFSAPLDQVFNARAGHKVFVSLPADAQVLTAQEYGERPTALKRPQPQIPSALQGRPVEEEVKVKFVIDPAGHVINPELVETPQTKELALPALFSVALTTYPKMEKDGKPVYVSLTQTVKFGGEVKPAGP